MTFSREGLEVILQLGESDMRLILQGSAIKMCKKNGRLSQSQLTFAFLAAASAFTWLGVRLFGVRLGPTDWLDAVDLELSRVTIMTR